MPFSTTWLMLSGPRRLMAMSWSQSSGVVSTKLTKRSQPALFTSTSVGPLSFSNWAIALPTAS